MQKQQEQELDLNTDLYYLNFINCIKSKTTKTDYIIRIKYFMKFIGASTCAELIEDKDQKTIENMIKSYLIYLRQNRRVSYTTANHYFAALKKFYYVNTEFQIRWGLINQYMGSDEDEDTITTTAIEGQEEDRPYTRSEIQTMLKTATDIRVKIIVLLMSSSGMRLGAINLLKIRNLTYVKDYNLYQINVYEKSKKSNYKTFCTPECAAMIDIYLNYRKHCGEILKPESPLIREQFNTKDQFQIQNPRHVKSKTIQYLINQLLIKHSALKTKIAYDYKMKRKIGKSSTMQTHALRKFFDTECRKAGVYPDLIELLMGHKLDGIRSHYFKPDLETLFVGTEECKGYINAINALTINDENRLKMQNEELKTTLEQFSTFGQELAELKKYLGITK